VTDALWYLGRGTGVVSLLLLSLVVALGILTRSGRPVTGLPRFAIGALHRNASLLAVLLLGVHVLTLLADPYAQLRLVDLVLPFAGRYRPVWLGLGTLGLDLIVALVATSLLRHRIGQRSWRAVHWLAYLCWPVAVLHGLGTGTDSGQGWLRAVVAVCVAAVVGCVGWRLSAAFGSRPDPGFRAVVPPPSTAVGARSTWDGVR
jgi:methionine sulfoxide reductase heme-binding subunit